MDKIHTFLDYLPTHLASLFYFYFWSFLECVPSSLCVCAELCMLGRYPQWTMHICLEL